MLRNRQECLFYETKRIRRGDSSLRVRKKALRNDHPNHVTLRSIFPATKGLLKVIPVKVGIQKVRFKLKKIPKWYEKVAHCY